MTTAESHDTFPLGPVVEWLGLVVEHADGDQVRARWSAQPHLMQPFGVLHGGVHCAAVETLASIGAALWAGALVDPQAPGSGGRVVGVHNATDFLRPVSEGMLRSHAEPVHRGRSQQLWTVHTYDERERLVARGQVRLQNLV